MATSTVPAQCVMCEKEGSAVKCEGCSKMFCSVDLPIHHQKLNQQLKEIEQNHDLFRETLIQLRNDPQQHLLFKEIYQWEKESIEKIKQSAEECRQLLCHRLTKHFNQIEMNLTRLTDQLKDIRQKNDFNR